MKEGPDCAGSVRQAACLLSPSLGPAERELDLHDAHGAELAGLNQPV